MNQDSNQPIKKNWGAALKIILLVVIGCPTSVFIGIMVGRVFSATLKMIGIF